MTQLTKARELGKAGFGSKWIRRKNPNPWDVWVYSSVDYGALEMCTLAQVEINLFGDSKLAEAINSGQDLHVRMAARIAGISYEEALARKTAKDGVIIDLRQASKPINFGLPGLMGEAKLVYTARKDGVRFCELARLTPVDGCGKNEKVTDYKGRKIPPTCSVCLDLAKEYRALWYEEWGLDRYHEVTVRIAEECEEGTPLESFGTGMKRLETSPNAVSNHYFQNLAAQGAKNAGWLLAKESYTDRRSVLFNNYRTAVFVHDETIAEIREPVAHEAAHRQAELMREGMRPFVPDVKITAEPALMRRWFKGAEKATTKDGRLKPWWPTDKDCPFGKASDAHAPGCKCWTWGPDQALMFEDLRA